MTLKTKSQHLREYGSLTKKVSLLHTFKRHLPYLFVSTLWYMILGYDVIQLYQLDFLFNKVIVKLTL